MTMNDFNSLCTSYSINPAIALENDLIVETLLNLREAQDDNSRRGYRNVLINILETQF